MIICQTCNDSHGMWSSGLERYVPCTRCPTPCAGCAYKKTGAYCAAIPCLCECHVAAKWQCTKLMITGLELTDDRAGIENGLVGWVDQIALELATRGDVSVYYRHELNLPRRPMTTIRTPEGHVIIFRPGSITYTDGI